MKKFDRITMDPKVMGGKACIRGIRITAGMVVELISIGQTPEDIIREYPMLEPEDIKQALAFAAWKASEVEVPLESGA